MGYQRFGLTLMVTHACNMRCHYCYTGEKALRRMPPDIGDAAIRRALASLSPGGHLSLGFFGGEPLLEAPAIHHWIDHARTATARANKTASFHLTTNGTIDSPAARDLLEQPDLRVAVSFDGLPAVHDRFRIYADGRGTSAAVRRTIERLVTLRKPFSVIMVVRPDTAPQLAAGITYLRSLGVQSIEPSLDLWTHWTRDDARILRRAIADAATLWAEGLPTHALNWFDEKAAELARITSPDTRCSFGDGELAIAPSGNHYPCERLIGEDQPGHPMRLPGHALDAQPDFSPLTLAPLPRTQPDACHTCAMHTMCNTNCRCSNFIRTGDTDRPDGLLCMLNQACLEEVAARLEPAPRTTQLPVLSRT